MPLISALEKQRQVDLCEFKASLFYIVSSRTAGARDFVSERPKKQKQRVLVWTREKAVSKGHVPTKRILIL